MKTKRQPRAYYEKLLAAHKLEYDALDEQIRHALKPLAKLKMTEVMELELRLKPQTDRIAVLKREMAVCRRELLET